MTLQQLNDLCKRNNIPENVRLLSDSGWECSETDMDGVYYSKDLNTIVFTQDYYDDRYIGGDGHDSHLPKGSIFMKIK